MNQNAQPAVPVADAIDRFIKATGHVLCWAYALLVVVILLQVTLRYGFRHGLVTLEELQWHLYAVAVMFGLAYAQATDSHIRVDLFHARISHRARLLWEVFGLVFLMFPFVFVVLYSSFDFVADAWRVGERSSAPAGLPWRWAIKSVIPLSFALLFLAGLSRLVRDVSLLLRGVR